MEPSRFLTDLNEAQRTAVTSEHAPLRILAGAGSGKTRVLTRRIGWRCAIEDADPRHVLALTFTRKAAGELRDRLRQLGLRDAVAAGTFHGIAWAQLQGRWADRGVRPPELLTRKVGLVAEGLPANLRRDGTTALDVTTELEWAAARMVEPDDYPAAARRAGRAPSVRPELVADAYTAFREAKRRRRLVDFDDLLRLWRRDLTQDPDFAAVQRWRFRHLFVDEFQDVNPAQHALLEALVGDGSDLCIVGDPNQAIYAWNGADAGYLVDFDRHWPGGGTVRLVDNYRSTPQVLALANAVLRSGGGTVDAALRPHRADGPDPTVRALPDDGAEATAVARAVRDRHRPGGTWRRQAVLVRTNAQTAAIEQALRAAGIPCRVRGGGALLEQPEVRAALRGLRDHPGPFEAVVAELEAEARRHRRGGDGTAEPADGSDDEVLLDDRGANLDQLARLARDYADVTGTPAVPAFLAWLQDFARGDLRDPTGDAVDVVTFHAAKGLEWPVVHLAGLEDGYVPIGHAKLPAEQAEERRLFYVAVTRAEEELHCTWAQSRTFGSRARVRQRSPFLDEASRAGALPGAPTPAATASGRTAPDRPRRAAPADVAPGDRPLFEALRAWRAELARASRMPPYVVANDATLKSVATDRPTSADDLLATPGLGPAKVTRYGEDLLRLVAEHTEGVEPPAPGALASGAQASLGLDEVDAAPNLGPDPELLAALKAWRTATAESEDVPPYRVLSDRSLRDLAQRRPVDLAGLRAVHGIGPAKLERWGEALLEVVTAAEAPTA